MHNCLELYFGKQGALQYFVVKLSSPAGHFFVSREWEVLRVAPKMNYAKVPLVKHWFITEIDVKGWVLCTFVGLTLKLPGSGVPWVRCLCLNVGFNIRSFLTLAVKEWKCKVKMVEKNISLKHWSQSTLSGKKCLCNVPCVGFLVEMILFALWKVRKDKPTNQNPNRNNNNKKPNQPTTSALIFFSLKAQLTAVSY